MKQRTSSGYTRMKLMGIVFIALFLCAGLFLEGCKVQKSSSNTQPLTAFFNLSLKKLDGNTFQASELKGKVILVNFWASWCGPCREEIPDLEELYKNFKDQGVVILGVSVDESIEDAQSFMNEAKVSYPVVWDGPSGDVAKVFKGFSVLPTSYLIDQSGVLRKRILGPRRYPSFKKMLLDILNP